MLIAKTYNETRANMRTLDTHADLRSLDDLDADTRRITRGFDTYGERLAAYYKGLSVKNLPEYILLLHF